MRLGEEEVKVGWREGELGWMAEGGVGGTLIRRCR